MIRLTTHLALIAYVIGGWLLPATHFHAAHTGPHAIESCGYAHGTGAAHSHDATQEACDHQHPASAAQCEAETNDFAHYWVASEHDHECVGLCALCSARTLNSTKWSSGIRAMGSRCCTKVLNSTGSLWSMPAFVAIHFSRGPPHHQV